MARVLLDIHLSEAQVNRAVHQYDTARMAFKYAQKEILKKHGVTDSAFRHSYDYYVQEPETLDKIYETVIDSLNRLEVKLNEKETKESKRNKLSKPKLKTAPAQ